MNYYEEIKNYPDAVRSYEVALKTRPGWLDAIRDFSELLIHCQETKQAQELENAGREGDIDRIKKDTGKFLEKYEWFYKKFDEIFSCYTYIWKYHSTWDILSGRMVDYWHWTNHCHCFNISLYQ